MKTPPGKKVRTSNKPPAFKARVRAMSAMGVSSAKIARSLKISGTTVHRILNEPEARQDLEQAKLLFMSGALEAVKSYLRKCQKDDMMYSTRLLVANGILPRELAPELNGQINLPQNMQQLQFVLQHMSGRRESEVQGSISSSERADRAGTLALEMLEQMSGTAKRHQIPLNSSPSNNNHGHGSNGNGKKPAAEIELEELKKD